MRRVYACLFFGGGRAAQTPARADGTEVGEGHRAASRDEAALRLGICVGSIPQFIERGVLPAEQVTPYAPWQIPVEALKDKRVQVEVLEIHRVASRNLHEYRENKTLKLRALDGGDA